MKERKQTVKKLQKLFLMGFNPEVSGMIVGAVLPARTPLHPWKRKNKQCQLCTLSRTKYVTRGMSLLDVTSARSHIVPPPPSACILVIFQII